MSCNQHVQQSVRGRHQVRSAGTLLLHNAAHMHLRHKSARLTVLSRTGDQYDMGTSTMTWRREVRGGPMQGSLSATVWGLGVLPP